MHLLLVTWWGDANGCCENKNHGGKMEIKKQNLGKLVLWGIIGLLLLVVIFATFFNDARSVSTLGANAGQAASAYSGMVGGC